MIESYILQYKDFPKKNNMKKTSDGDKIKN
jgi:hypothetical protein